MPSYLGNYPRAAKDRDYKFIRAVQSVVKQSFTDWQLVVVSDGCELTCALLRSYIMDLPTEIRSKILGLQINKNKIWSGRPRNVGLDNATGEIICYLDSDDYFQLDHLQFINDNFTNAEYIYFDDLNFKHNEFKPNKISMKNYGRCGTSNIAHLRKLPIRWPNAAMYSHDDWGVIKQLQNHRGRYVGQGGYCVCHIPNTYDV